MTRRKPARGRDGFLRFLSDVLGIEHLHFGLWDGDPETFEGLKTAQDRYADHLCSLIDPNVNRILDCGCGIGTTAQKLKALGYEVEGLTPDAYQKELFEERTGLTCHLARFQDFRSDRPYDLVLMSESCGYIPVDQIFPALKRTAAGGRWLLADFFTHYKDGTVLTNSGHLLQDFLSQCTEAGLNREYEEDITDQVIPTLKFVHDILEQRVWPTTQMLKEYLSDRYPTLYPPTFKLVRYFTRKFYAKMERQLVLVDPQAFRQAKSYMIYKFLIP